jgi:hypothetical protein
MKEYASQIETMLQNYVVPEFTSPVAFLRERVTVLFVTSY